MTQQMIQPEATNWLVEVVVPILGVLITAGAAIWVAGRKK